MEVNFQPYETLVFPPCPLVLVCTELVIGIFLTLFPHPFYNTLPLAFGDFKAQQAVQQKPPLKWSYGQIQSKKKKKPCNLEEPDLWHYRALQDCHVYS